MRVLGDARHVVHERHAVLVAPGAHGLQVLERERLAARHVDAGRDADIRNLVGANLVD